MSKSRNSQKAHMLPFYFGFCTVWLSFLLMLLHKLTFLEVRISTRMSDSFHFAFIVFPEKTSNTGEGNTFNARRLREIPVTHVNLRCCLWRAMPVAHVNLRCCLWREIPVTHVNLRCCLWRVIPVTHVNLRCCLRSVIPVTHVNLRCCLWRVIPVTHVNLVCCLRWVKPVTHVTSGVVHGV